MVDNHNDTEYFPELSKTLKIMKLLDQMPTHLIEMFGISKVALSYIFLDDPNSPVPLPTLQPNLIWSLENSITMDKLVAYTPHTGPEYEADNAQVYNLLANSLEGTITMTSITRHKRQRDVRSAYLDLFTQNTGSAKWEKTA